MTPEEWASLKDLFHGALEQPENQRTAWLLEATGGDRVRAALVLDLLQASDTAGDFLERPATLAWDDVEQASAPASVFTSDNVFSSDDLEPGARVGAYEIVREIGRGGMGIVYLARDTRLVRDVALKVLPPDTSHDPMHRQRLRREARAAATITHPAVATVYAFEEIDGRLIIATEYVSGRSLRDVIKDGPLPPERAVELTCRIVDALQAAHAVGVVHRDLKPDNVIVTAAGGIKLVDFGIAYTENPEGPRFTQEGVLLGTPAYMSPEQLAGGTVDGRTDVYAVGVLLSEMITGRHPLADGGPPALPPDIATIVTRCLQPSPAGRYQSAGALLAAFRGPVHPPGPTPGPPIWWWRFHQAAAALAYAGLLVPAWVARQLTGDQIAWATFVVLLIAAIAATTMRLHLLFVSRSGDAAVADEHARHGRWMGRADLFVAAGLIGMGVRVESAHSALGVLLIAGGVAAAVAAWLIEPSTTRAAFPARRD